MRVVAGSARGRPIAGPKGKEIRPTSDRVRETLFNVLGQQIEGEVLDLYAGTGALAIEALSRGASRAVLVDAGREAQRLCVKNLEALGFAGQAEVLAMPVDRALDLLERRGGRFALVTADPPYAAHAAGWLLARLAASSLLADEGTLVIECDRREPVPEQPGLLQVDERRFGDTLLRLFRRAGQVRRMAGEGST